MRGLAFGSVMLGLCMAACGGGGAKDTNEPTGGGDGGGGGDEAAGDGDVMVPPEKMDEINVRLDRKRATAARCLSDAILSGAAPKSTRGKMTIEFVVSPAGRAESIKVVKSSINNEAVESCVIGKIAEIAFPELPKPLDWSYTYSVDSN